MLSYIFNHWGIIYCGVKDVYMMLPLTHLLNVINLGIFWYHVPIAYSVFFNCSIILFIILFIIRVIGTA